MGELAVSSGDGETSEDDFPDSGSDYSTNNVGKKKEFSQQEAKGNKWKSNSALESHEKNMTQSRKEK